MYSSREIQEDLNDDVEVAEISPPQVASRVFSRYATFDDTGLTLEELPDPTLWRVLVLPLQAKTKTESGILLARSATEAERQLQYMGQVLKVGVMAGKSDKLENPLHVTDSSVAKYPFDVKPLEWIMYGRYAGFRISYKGIQLLFVNDDEIIAKIVSPENYEVYL